MQYYRIEIDFLLNIKHLNLQYFYKVNERDFYKFIDNLNALKFPTDSFFVNVLIWKVCSNEALSR